MANDRTHLHIIPRTAPSYTLPQGPLELNALGYAGYMLVKSAEDKEALVQVAEKDGLQSVLLACATPREQGQDAEQALEKVHDGGEMF